MKGKFKIERSIYALGMFIALIGVLFLIARSDAVLKFKYFNEPSEHAVVRQEVEGSQNVPSYLLLTGPDQPALQNSLKKRLELMGKDVEVRPISSIESEADLSGYASVVVATEQIDLLKETNIVLRFVQHGGSLFFAVRPSPGPALSTLYQPLGLVETGNFIETTGIKLENPFFGDNGDTVFISDSIINSSLSVRLSGDAKLFASSSSDIPLLWKATYGEGAFIVFNGTMFTAMTDQSLFVKGIQQASEHVIMPIVNGRVTELSGFPFFVPEGRDLSPSYTNRDYYRTVVWPELQRIESKFNLNYTASYLAPVDTGRTDNAPYPVHDDLKLYGRELLRMGGEIAVQLPLSKNADQIASSHDISVQHIKEVLPGYAIRSTSSSSPEVDVELMKDASTTLVPNTDVQKMEKTIVLPKTIEGFSLDDNKKWQLFNELALSGFYAHSLYPNRFFEEGNAEEQLSAFTDLQQSMKDQVPWLRSLTLSKAGEAAYAYIYSDLYEEQDGDKLIFRTTAMKENAHTYYYFSTNRTIAKTEDCKVEKIGEDLYLVEADKLTFSIVLGGLQ
ncbi:DUF2194 domain-containing protein [Ureibacillus sinduriensis]|uniref:DUF2194 domain-containing protein n=1 Tax=Ureibacillus sinduriensis BLB-1 = JCM 15800 TaxID=1384057 RepID=A0A0A3HYF8_9BACL|nr:DUF2194 domain-containing protein [Ureibacillus sinduriensis]KGR75398.1 hypothetical protein CD33_11810 [Ureibacillus sinduriensis BLB-1 = JCM 15800]